MSNESAMLLFRALSALLSYPTAELRAGLAEITDVVGSSPLIGPRERVGLRALVDEIGQDDLLTAEERYVDLFDRGRALSLHLFEHVHGEGRDRGAAMVELKELYAAAGFDLATRELPDYLPVVLEYLSLGDIAEARDMLSDCVTILTTIARALLARQSRYAAVPQALLVIAGERPVDAAAVKPVRERTETLDRDWAEQPAFADVAPPPARPIS
jgi:nitrate reductase delta subunit